MKLPHILGILAIAIAIGVIVSTAGDASQYVSFQQAFAMAADGDEAKVHVVGELKKDAAGNVLGLQYDPQTDANYLSFVLIDDQKTEHRVVCYNPPASMQDFAKSEKVVVIGRAKQGQAGQYQFVASEVLMKCPSKYEENQL